MNPEYKIPNRDLENEFFNPSMDKTEAFSLILTRKKKKLKIYHEMRDGCAIFA